MKPGELRRYTGPHDRLLFGNIDSVTLPDIFDINSNKRTTEVRVKPREELVVYLGPVTISDGPSYTFEAGYILVRGKLYYAAVSWIQDDTTEVTP